MILLAAFLACTVDPPTNRQRIEAVLADMSRAVLAADKPAFLTFVAPDEPFLHAEWSHWADQLATAKPAEFSLAIADGPATFDDARRQFPLIMSWRIDNGPPDSWGAGGKTRNVTFPPVRFSFDDPDAEGPLPPRWLFRGEAWERRECDRFTIYYLPGSEKVVHEVFQAFPVARDHDNEGFGVNPGPQVLKLYTSMDHLKATVYLNMPDDYLGGWSEKDESIKFMTRYTSGIHGWTNAYAHEYGHVCEWEMGPKASSLPWWVAEGAAELAAQEYRPGYWQRLDTQMRARAAKGTLAEWDDISDYIKTRPPLKILAYTQGHHMVGYISMCWDREGRNKWLRAMCEGATLDEATRRVLGRPFTQLDREWRAELARTANNPPAADKETKP